MSTPIQRAMQAIREGDSSTFRKMLSDQPELLTEHGPTMLEHAAEENQLELMSILVDLGIDPNHGSGWHTVLGLAASSGALEAVGWLLDHGAEIDGRAEARAPTPLHE